MSGLFRCVPKPMLIKPAAGRLILTPLGSARSRLIPRTRNTLVHPRQQFRDFASAKSKDGRNGITGAAEPLGVTWLAPNPAAVTPDHIIPNLPILPATSDKQHRTLVYLVTPAFASWVDESHPFLKESIEHIFQDAHGPACVDEEFQAVVAVIDQLPSPRGRHIENGTEKTSAIEDGFEGLSMLLVDRNHLAGEVAKASTGKGSSPSEPVMTYSVKSLRRRDGSSISHEVGFRLANTLFVNGNHRTIFASSWRHDRSSDDLILKQKRDLSTCQIGSTSEPEVSLQLPLHPVTQRRKVLFSMGNILRQVAKGSGSDEPIPASSELEKELPIYVKENNLTNQRLVVWALIEPPTEAVIDSSNEMDGGRVPHSIRNGARLHRVVSGGGGWGKKQGLLSLDPENQFTGDRSAVSPIGDILENVSVHRGHEDATPEDSFPGFPSFGEESEITSINKIAKDGEFVQFFVAPEGGSASSEENASSKSGADTSEVDQRIDLSSSPTLTCTFGAISTPDDGISSVEENEPSSNSSADAAKSSSLISLKNYFGALSEKGITYSSSVYPGVGSSGGTGENTKEVCATKIGVPGARVRFV